MGQLGLTSSTVSTGIPLKLYLLQSSVSSISAGRDHSLFTAEDGIYVSGSNAFNQLCVDTAGEEILFEPQALNIPIDSITSFEAIQFSSFILYVDGSVSACGSNQYGQLGDGTTDEQRPVTTVEIDNVVHHLGAGPSAESAFFVTEDERVFGTGLNSNGQLGVNDLENRNVPTEVLFDQLVLVHLLSAGSDHTLSLKDSTGEGTPAPSNSSTGTMIPTYSPTSSSYSPTSMPTTYAPTGESLTLFFWGSSESVGEESDEDVAQPLNVGGDTVHSSAGSRYTVIVLKDGSVLSAGLVESINDYQGHLGIDQDAVVEGMNKFQPVSSFYDSGGELMDTPRFDKVFAGVESTAGVIHTILLDQNGNVYATGSNSAGQLCLGDEEDRMAP
eukprot:scaffold2811_cov188-Alexandrium_tamarense.AAC.1